MNRITIYDTEQGRPFDFLTAEKMTLEGLGQLTQDVLGGITAMATGLTATQTSPASLSINLAAGALYQAATVDPTPWGALPADTAIAFIQGVIQASPSLWLYNPSGAPSQGALTFSTAALTAGQSQYALVEAQFSFVDVVAPGDPSGGEVPYFNPANPAQPLIGPGGSGQTQPTMRLATAVFQIKYGTPATTGSEVPPTLDSGWVPLFLIDLAYGQTSIGTANILVAGPSVGLNVPSNYPAAPFLAGLLNSHHSGVPGQAPQIILTNGKEVQGTLPLANLPASDTVGVLPTVRYGNSSGTPAVAGQVSDLYFDTGGGNLYYCTVTGGAGSATWVKVTTVASATPGGSASNDLGGSYPGPSVVAIQGVQAASGQTLAAGQFMIGNTTPAYAPIALSGDAAGSATTPGQIKIVGVYGVQIAAGPSVDGSALTYSAGTGKLTWQVPSPTTIAEYDTTRGTDLALTTSMQQVMALSVTLPSTPSGKYRIRIKWGVLFEYPATGGAAFASFFQLTDGTNIFGQRAQGGGSAGTSGGWAEGCSDEQLSPSYNAGTTVNIQLMAAAKQTGTIKASVATPVAASTYMSVYVERSA
jgi:hypothetical protein